VQRGVDAAEDRQRDDDDEGEDGELERVDQRVAEHLGDGTAEGERVAHVERQQAGDPVEVLRDQRFVGAEPLVQGVHRPLVRERPEDRPPDVARQNLRADEHDEAEQHQRDQAEHDALADEAAHYGTRPVRLRS
jgi:hypothetical protein